GKLSRADSISYGLTGPLLRATGVPYDVRKAEPYLVYDRIDFSVPTGTSGDNYDRFMVRMAEMEQSMRIIEQALANLPEGPIAITDPRYFLPPKQEVYTSIEGLMNHFTLVSGRPYRVRVRPPSFYGMGALGDMLRGRMLADIIPTFGQINMIGGECDH